MMTPKAHIRVALLKRNWRYAQLAAALGETEANIRNKMSRGTFSATWFLKALAAIGCDRIDLETAA